MPFRERLKKTFSRSGSKDETSLHKSPTSDSGRAKNDPSIYQPGEKMPRPKYRAPVDKKHAASLAAFNFAEAWRRKSSGASQYSPFGTRAPSRNVSRRASREQGGGGGGGRGGGQSRRGSSNSVSGRRGSLGSSLLRRRSGPGPRGSKDDGVVSGMVSPGANAAPEPVAEVLGENGTPIAPGATPKPGEGKSSPPLEKHPTKATAGEQPFTSEELMLAYQKSITSKAPTSKPSS